LVIENSKSNHLGAQGTITPMFRFWGFIASVWAAASLKRKSQIQQSIYIHVCLLREKWHESYDLLLRRNASIEVSIFRLVGAIALVWEASCLNTKVGVRSIDYCALMYTCSAKNGINHLIVCEKKDECRHFYHKIGGRHNVSFEWRPA